MARPHPILSLSITALCLLLASGCGSTASPQPDPNLRTLALRLADLPPQTASEPASIWTQPPVARRAGLYDLHGRIGSYQVSFDRHVMNGSMSTWLLHADNEIAEYRDVAAARRSYRQLRAAMRTSYVSSATSLGSPAGQTATPVAFRSLRAPLVGDQDAAFTVDWGGAQVAYTTRVLVFRRHRYVTLLRIFGLQDQVPLTRLVALGRAIDRRITTAR